MTCDMILDREQLTVNGQKVKSSPGFCTTYNVVYLVQCQICEKCYVGRTVNSLRARIGQHRTHFYEICDGKAVDFTKDDDYSIGLHLFHEHHLSNRFDFKNFLKVCIVDICSPKLLEFKEHKYIHLLKTLRPLGMNTVNPFGLRLFH